MTDQSLINEYFPHQDSKHRDLDQLPEPYNWKGYWGCSPSIVIVHWHGPKPERCLPCYLEHRSEFEADNKVHETACDCPDGYNELWRRAMVGDGGGLYAKMLHDQARYAVAAGESKVTGDYEKGKP